MRVGAASVEITPPLGLPMDGFEARVGGATGVHDPLMAYALVAEGEDGTAIALVVADLIQVEAGTQALAADRIARSTGIARERLQLAGTHTHSGPAVRDGTPLERAIAESLADVVERAWAGRRDATVAVGVGHVEGIGANRRPNGGPLDDRVTVARFDDASGAPIATLVNYGCHPTTLGPNNNLYSADYPGVLCRELAREVGGVVLFTTGAQGDVNPGGYSPEGSMVGVVVPWRTFESAERYGRELARVAADVHRGLRPAAGADGRVWGASRVLELARKPLPDPATARTAANAAIAAAEQVAAADLTPDATYHALVAAAYADLIATQAADAGRDAPVALRVSALGFGPLTHVGVQGELFVALGQRIRSALGDDTTCIAALCDGTVGYIPTAPVFAEGGYEPNASVLRPGEGERAADAVVELARAARDAERAGAGAAAEQGGSR